MCVRLRARRIVIFRRMYLYPLHNELSGDDGRARPQAVGYGLTDSPAGLAGWMCGGWRVNMRAIRRLSVH